MDKLTKGDLPDPKKALKNLTKSKKQQTSDGFMPKRLKGSKFAKK